MISRNIIIKNAPSNMDEQIHVNHEGCSAGVDTKRRLYIKRTYKGLVAYCHHCNEKGFAQEEGARLSTWLKSEGLSETTSSTALPTLTSVSTEGKMWLAKHYCDPIHFNGTTDPKKVVLSLRNIDNDVIGYQIRNLRPDATPKYITQYFSQSNRGDSCWFYNGNKTLVITEDFLSAYRVNRDTGLSSVALLRTTVSDSTLTQIYELDFDLIVIWLDPDEAGLEGTQKAYKKLQHYLPAKTRVLIYGLDKEPKQCTPKELIKLLI